jgi:alpha-tubulin suppressor-like RCC1 family protein
MDIDGERVEHIIADGILSKVIKKKGNVYHVINYGQNKETFLIKDGEIYSHGDTLEEARESIKYKIANRDTTEFEKYKLDDEVDLTTLIRAYRAITGACEAGTRYFCGNNTLPEKMTVAKAIELTQGQYNHDLFRKFFEEKENEQR